MIILLAKPDKSSMISTHLSVFTLAWVSGQALISNPAQGSFVALKLQFYIKQEIFKNFQATTVTNRFNIILLSLPH